jgi:hypothetical protein
MVIFHIPALAFAILFQIPGWPDIFEGVYGYPMVDRSVYGAQILDYNLPIDYLPEFDFISYFTFELLWNRSIAFLAREMQLSTDQIFFLLTTLIIWRFTFMIAVSAGWLYVPLLVNPLVVDFAFSQLRLATAIALVSFFWRSEKASILKISGYIAATSIHTAIVLFGAMHLASHHFSLPRFRNLAALVLFGFFVAIAIGPARELILNTIGDRRAEYHDMSSSILYLSFWIIVWALFLAQWRTAMATLDGRFAIIILSIVALNAVFQGYSIRFIAASFPSIVVAMAGWRSIPIALPIALFLPYSVLQWLYWLRVL